MPEVLELFMELAAIPSPPGEERAVADVVASYLRDCAVDVDEDDAGAKIGATAGNLYARLEPTVEGRPIFLCAHLDTVPPTGRIEPVVDDEGVVRNAAGTILGADDKAAIAAMLEATRRVLAERRAHAGIELLFTPKEEVGLIGAAAFDETRLTARHGFVYDQAAANVGTIHGGVAANIVAEQCTFVAEARSHDERRLTDLVQEMLESISFAAEMSDCRADVEARKSYRGYRFKRDDEVVQVATDALEIGR